MLESEPRSAASSPSRRRAGLLVLVAVVLVLLLAGGAVVLFSSDTSSGGVEEAGISQEQMTFDGVERRYRLYVPSSIDTAGDVPLVIGMHGNGIDEVGFAEQSGLEATAEEQGFVVVFPAAVEGIWNGGFSQKSRNVDDVGFLTALVDELASRYSIDTDRVFATGMSGGGMMSYRLACEAPELVAAIAPVAATMVVECDPNVPVSVIHIHGAGDPAIPVAGRADRDFPPVAEVVDAWSGIDGCGAEPQVATEDVATVTRWGECDAGTAVHFYSVEGLGHEYPRSDEGDAVDARELSWSFFSEHARTSG